MKLYKKKQKKNICICMVLYSHPFWLRYPSYNSTQRAQDSKVTNSDKTWLCLKSMLSWLNKMCWGCPVVPISIAGDVIDLPFIWDSAKDLAIDFTWMGEIWNVAFSIITSQLHPLLTWDAGVSLASDACRLPSHCPHAHMQYLDTHIYCCW